MVVRMELEQICIPVIIFRDERLSRSDKLVYLAIVYLVGTGDRTHYTDIADLADVSRAQVALSVRTLHEYGYIRRVSRPGEGNLYNL